MSRAPDPACSCNGETQRRLEWRKPAVGQYLIFEHIIVLRLKQWEDMVGLCFVCKEWGEDMRPLL